jgi:hypothetical protein
MNKREHSSGRVVFLLDVDNTLLDNDGVQADLRRHLIGNVGRKRAKEYWRMFELLRAELGYADYLGALQLYRAEYSRGPAPDIGLTELTKHAILSYPLPDQQSGEKFAAFTYLHSDAPNPICGTVHNVVSPEMLYISGSSGAKFDERARGLRGSKDVISAIQAASE